MKNTDNNKDLTKLHKEKLGMDIPEEFFSKSKVDILDAIPKNESEKRTAVFGLKPFIAYSIAASIVLLIGITMWMQNDTTEIDLKINTEQISSLNVASDDFLVTSLLVEDDKLDAFMDDFIMNEILVEAELSEQQLDNLFINSLFVEDSLINNYIGESLIENIVL